MSRTSKKKAQKKRRLIVMAVFLVIAIVGALVFFKYFKKSPVFVENPGTGYTDKKVYPGQDEREEKSDYIQKVPTEAPTPAKEELSAIAEKEPLPEDMEELVTPDNEGYLEVHFIDVGQGDAVLIKYVDTDITDGDESAAMLVDAGDVTKGTLVRNYLKKQGVDALDYFVCTHNDADHIGGAASVVSNVPIESEIIWGNGLKKDTKTYDNLVSEIETKWYSYEKPNMFEEYSLGRAYFIFLAPDIEHGDENNSSLVLKLWYDDTSFLLTGDASEEEELEMINGDAASFLSADVLKIGHHGSKYSTSDDFLALVSPKYAVISCGVGNSYGHPHQEVMNKIRSYGCDMFRTDVQGSIVATSDGENITWSTPACDVWGYIEEKTKL